MRNITLGFPDELYSSAQNIAFERGVSLSEIIRLSVAKECGFYGYSSIKWGGDRSSSKTKDTHARVCANMRAAKSELHKKSSDARIIEVNRILDMSERRIEEIKRMMADVEKKAREIDENESVSGAA